MTIKTKMKKKAISKYVLMPGGSRLKSRVKKALEKAKAPQSTIKKLDKIAPVIATDRAGLLESDLHFAEKKKQKTVIVAKAQPTETGRRTKPCV